MAERRMEEGGTKTAYAGEREILSIKKKIVSVMHAWTTERELAWKATYQHFAAIKIIPFDLSNMWTAAARSSRLNKQTVDLSRDKYAFDRPISFLPAQIHKFTWNVKFTSSIGEYCLKSAIQNFKLRTASKTVVFHKKKIVSTLFTIIILPHHR